MLNQDELHNNLIEELGIASLPDEPRNEILAQLSENIVKQLTLDVLSQLPKDARDEFDTISDSGDQVKLDAFLREKIPDIDTITQTSVRKTIDEFKELAGLNK